MGFTVFSFPFGFSMVLLINVLDYVKRHEFRYYNKRRHHFFNIFFYFISLKFINVTESILLNRKSDVGVE